MANNFSTDSRIIDFWQFENDLTAGKAGNDLTAGAGGVSYESGTPMEGAYSLKLVAASAQYAYRNDADLTTGFPLKNGDTVKKVSFAFWHKPVAINNTYYLVCKGKNQSGKRTIAIQQSNSGLIITIGWNSGNSWDTWTVAASGIFTAGQKYHIGFSLDGINKTASVRIWDDTAQAATTYTHTFTYEIYCASDQPFAVGELYGAGLSYLNGQIDELVVANDLLSADEFDDIRQGTFGGTEVTGTGVATQAAEAASAAGVHGVAGTASLIQVPGIAAVDGYGLVSGSGQIDESPAQAVASGVHGVSGQGSCNQTSAVVAAEGIFEIPGFYGIGQAIAGPSTAVGMGAHGVAGIAAVVEIAPVVVAEGNFISPVVGTAAIIQSPQIANGGGAHGVSGVVSVTRSIQMAAADGYCQVSGVGQAIETPGIIDAWGYQGFMATGVANIIQTPVRMIAYGTFYDPLRSRAKRYFESLPVSDLREKALIWIETEEIIDQNLREEALRWINGEINKAA
jgi:hypothetical protein